MSAPNHTHPTASLAPNPAWGMNACHLQQDTEVSLANGDAILIARDVVFRLHKAALARHSPDLARLVDHLGPAVEHRDGCPVVRVSDSPHDVRELLRVVHDLSTVPPDNPTPFPILAAWLRMGVKYDIEQLTERAVAGLRALFPRTLHGWDGRTDHCGFDEQHDAIHALNLFRAVGQFDMIPAAVYLCAQLDASVLRCDAACVDAIEWLSEADLLLVMNAKEQLKARGARMVEEFRGLQRPLECMSTSCGEALSQLACMCEDRRETLRGGDPLDRAFMEHIDELGEAWRAQGTEGECRTCVEDVLDQLARMRERVWDDLPAIAGVEDEVDDWGLC